MMNNKLLALLVLVGGLVLGGCSSIYDESEVIAFLQEPRSPVSGTEYRVLPPDVLHISSVHVSEIEDKTMQIRPDGKINLPLLGEIYVADMTPAQIEATLKDLAKPYYEQVDATVTIAAYRSQKYYVMGQVYTPGPIIWTGGDTLLDALAITTPTNLAWEERIVVIRSTPPDRGGYRVLKSKFDYRYFGIHPPSDDKPRYLMTVNLLAMMEHGDLSKNVLLKPGDIIYVPPTPLAKLGLEIQELLFPVRPFSEVARIPGALILP